MTFLTAMKFAIDIQHELAWRVVQELGHVLNQLEISKNAGHVRSFLTALLRSF